MLESEKLIQIVQSWLSYIRLEELTTAEVERGSERFPKIFNDNVRLVGNKLLLSSELFKQFQQQQQAAVNRDKPNEFQIAAAFPQIYLVQGRGKEQKLKYLPLFTIDISQIFRGKYRKTGWDLTEFEFQPVIVNLMRLYGLEEEVAESLIVTEGIFKFLEDTWQRKFPSLHDFIDQVDLPEGRYKTFRQPYLLRCDFVPYNVQLKQDLRDILKQRFKIHQIIVSGWLIIIPLLNTFAIHHNHPIRKSCFGERFLLTHPIHSKPQHSNTPNRIP